MSLLELRRAMKRKKPDFIRQDSHKKAKLGKAWGRAKGLHSKIKDGKSGKRRKPSVGYGSPRDVRGLHRSGLKEVLTHSINGLENIDNKIEGIVIGSTVGLRKRAEIIKKAKDNGIKILNVRDADAYLKDIEEGMKGRKEKKNKAEAKKKDKEKEPKKGEKGLAEKIKSEDELKEEDKKEKDKVLTKKDSM